MTQNFLTAEPLDRSHGALEGEIGSGGAVGNLQVAAGGGLEIVFESLAGLHIIVTCGEPDALLYDFNAKMKVIEILVSLGHYHKVEDDSNRSELTLTKSPECRLLF